MASSQQKIRLNKTILPTQETQDRKNHDESPVHSVRHSAGSVLVIEVLNKFQQFNTDLQTEFT